MSSQPETVAAGRTRPRTLEAVRAMARERSPARLAVVCAEDAVALDAAHAAVAEGIVEPVLYGQPAEIAAKAPPGLLERSEVVRADAPALAAALAAAAAGRGEVDVILKGRLRTDELLRAVLSTEAGLRTGRLLSDVLIYEDRAQGEPRIVGVSDGGLVIAPTLSDKREIVRNAVQLFHCLGFPRPLIAIMSATEVVSPAIPSTVDAQILTEEAARGDFGECEVYGPLALDNALDPAAASAKGINHPVAGHADCMIAPSIEAGNLLGKATKFLGSSVCGHVIVGARVPILIPSRVESAADKLTSIALGVIAHADA